MMPDNAPHQPHDKLFKSSFSDPAAAVGFLKTQVPPSLAARLDWGSLRVEAGSFIDDELRGTESDLLYRVGIQEERAYLYLLFEHQRLEDPWLAFRLLRYLVRIWEKYRRENPTARRLPAVIPVVLAQNAKPWGGSTHFHDLVAVPEELASEVLPRTPGFEYQLLQLAELPFDKILGTPLGVLTLRVLKGEKLKKLLDPLIWDETLWRHLSEDELRRLMYYIYLAGDVDKTGFTRKVRELHSPELRENAMTLAQQFRQEGRQEGRQEEGVRLLRRQLERRFGALPDWAQFRLTEGSLEDLDLWSERILDARIVEDVFA